MPVPLHTRQMDFLMKPEQHQCQPKEPEKEIPMFVSSFMIVFVVLYLSGNALGITLNQRVLPSFARGPAFRPPTLI